MIVYLVTNRKLGGKDYYKRIEEALASGVDRVILREKDLGYKDLKPIVLRLKDLTDKYSKDLIINGNLDLAREFNAYSYHTSFHNFINKRPDYNRVGVSVHSITEAIEAEKQGADYLLVGHIFKTACKEGLEPRGLKFLKTLSSRVRIPVVAIGGINEKNKLEISACGVDSIAVMSYIMSSDEAGYRASLLKGVRE